MSVAMIPTDNNKPAIANARLIAAAPDLLAALKEYFEGYEGTRAEREARARAAIAKAEVPV